MAKRGRKPGSKNKKEIPLSEESKSKLEQGLKEAKEGKLETIEIPIIGEIKLNKDQQERLDKAKALAREMNKTVGVDIKFASDLEDKGKQLFGIDFLDKLTNGGIKRGQFSTIWGDKGCTKTTIALIAIAKAQSEGKMCIYLDMERSYDEKWAKRWGVNTNNLILVQVTTAEQALDVIIRYCSEKTADFIVLDSIHSLSPKGEQFEGKTDEIKSTEKDTQALLARKLGQFFRMAIPYVSNANCAILLIGQTRTALGGYIALQKLSGGHALLHYSRLILHVHEGQSVDAPMDKYIDEDGKKKERKAGIPLVVKVDKSQMQGCKQFTEVRVPYYFETGFKEE